MSAAQKKITFFIILLITFIDWTGVGLVYPMFSSMLFEEGYLLPIGTTTDLQKGIWLGVLLATMPIAQFFSSPIIGALSDQKGRKPLLKVTLLLTIIGYGLAFWGAVTQNLLILILSRIVIGVGAGNMAVVSASLADISAENEKVKNFGYLNMAYGLGFTLGPYLGGKLSVISSLGGLAAPFVFAAAASILCLSLVLTVFKETHTLTSKAAISITKGSKNFIKAFSNPDLKYLFGCVFIFCFGWSFFWEFIPVHWIKQYKFTSTEIGSFYAYGAAFYALSCGLFLKPLSQRFKPAAMYFFGLIGLGASIGLFLIDTSTFGLWAYIPLQQILLSLLFPTASAMVSMWVKGNSQGEMLGVLSSVTSSAFAFSPLVSGFLVGASHFSPIWAGTFSMFLAAILFYYGCIRNKFSLKSLLAK